MLILGVLCGLQEESARQVFELRNAWLRRGLWIAGAGLLERYDCEVSSLGHFGSLKMSFYCPSRAIGLM